MTDKTVSLILDYVGQMHRAMIENNVNVEGYTGLLSIEPMIG